MSDPYGSYGGANDPNQPSNPPSGQPQQSQPTGQPSYYGQNPYPAGAQGYPTAPGQYGVAPGGYTDRRPGRVTAGCVIAIVLCALVTLFGTIMAFAVAMVPTDELNSIPGMTTETTGMPGDDMIQTVKTAMTVMMVVVAAIAIVGLICSIFALRRSNGARITTVVLAFIAAAFYLLSLLGSAGDAVSMLVSLVFVAGSVTSGVLLLGQQSAAWYQAKNAPVAPGYPPMPPGARPY